MEAIIRWALKFAVIIGVVVSILACFNNPVHAAEPGWSGKPVYKVAESDTGPIISGYESCPTYITQVFINGYDTMRSSCMFGTTNTTRVARYTSHTGQYAYAIAFKSDTEFIPLSNVCFNFRTCGYSYSEDTFLIKNSVSPYKAGHALIKHFTKYLRLQVNGLTKEYVFDYDAAPLRYIDNGAYAYATNAIGISENGRWALIELENYGFVRVDLRTLEYKRVIAPGAVYGVANDPWFELTISNDGRHGAVTGYRAGLDVYEFTQTCGDVLTTASMYRFHIGVEPCPQALLYREELFPSFWYGQIPRFTDDGMRLSLYVQRLHDQKRAVVSPIDSNSSGALRYVAFGDSFTSGEGETDDAFYLGHTNTEANKCHVSTRSYPMLAGEMWGIPTENRACSGSRLPDVRKVVRDMSGEAPPTTVSLSIGGNDVDFIGKLKTCLGVGTCEWAKEASRPSTAEEIRSLYPRLLEEIHEIQSRLLGARLIVVGYPVVINDAVSGSCDPLVSVMLNTEERTFMTESIRLLNSVIKRASHNAGVRYVDIEQAFQGERLCEGAARAMNGVRTGDDIAPVPLLTALKFIGAESFHPTPFGHTRVANQLRASYDPYVASYDCGGCNEGLEDTQLSSYWEGDGSPVIGHQQAQRLVVGDRLGAGADLQLQMPEGSFAPDSEVTVEIHSDAQRLATTHSHADGSIEVSVSVPDEYEGYHTIFVIGKSMSGESIRYYQTIFIGEVGLASNLTTNQKDQTGAGSAHVKKVGALDSGIVATQTTMATSETPILPQDILGATMSPSQNKVNAHEVHEHKTNRHLYFMTNLGLKILYVSGGLLIACGLLLLVLYLKKRGT